MAPRKKHTTKKGDVRKTARRAYEDKHRKRDALGRFVSTKKGDRRKTARRAYER